MSLKRIFSCDCLNRAVSDKKGETAGKIKDIVLMRGDYLPRISAVIVSNGKKLFNDADEKVVTEIMSKYSLVALPVVNNEGILLGIVTIEDIIGRVISPDSKRKR